MAKTYEVRLVVREGSAGSRLYEGSKRECNAYIKQAIKKGQLPERLQLQEILKYAIFLERDREGSSIHHFSTKKEAMAAAKTVLEDPFRDHPDKLLYMSLCDHTGIRLEKLYEAT